MSRQKLSVLRSDAAIVLPNFCNDFAGLFSGQIRHRQEGSSPMKNVEEIMLAHKKLD